MEGDTSVKKTITRTFCFDDDICDVLFRYDDTFDKYCGEYPDFEEQPRYTPKGRMWITAMQSACPHSKNRFFEQRRCEDCGSCAFFLTEKQGDLVGVCSNEKNIISHIT